MDRHVEAEDPRETSKTKGEIFTPVIESRTTNNIPDV